MLLKGFAVAAGLVFAVAASAGILLDVADVRGAGRDRDTLALAPISLGNPTAAATLRTRTPAAPVEAARPAEAGTPSFQYKLRVGRGDTLAGLLTGAGVAAADAHGAIQALSKHFNPKHIRLGEEIAVVFRPPAPGTPEAEAPTPGRFLGIVVEPAYDVAVHVERADGGGFEAHKVEKTLAREAVRAEGTITSSLYIAGGKAGLPQGILAELIRAYSWDVDFQRDIREGDRFEVMYDRVFDATGDTVHAGPIHFAALVLSGKRHRIYLHTTENGTQDYFDEKGRSARKALMRTPIDGARLSSGFGKRRHPILGYTKMHRGVDFAAPRGTPIYAAGNGVVEAAGPNGAYGTYVRIRHNGRYSTAYAHMRAFARGLAKGKRVTQGQIIGYVGTTGRSTGPHLHYEILVEGHQTNPLKVRMPSGIKLAGDALDAFEAARAATDAAYATLAQEAVAETSNDSTAR